MRSVHSDAYRALTRLLKDARKRSGLTQQQVANRLKRPQSFVAKYESGERRLDVVEFALVAEAIETSPTRLLAAMLKQMSP
jgi:transcriptional regulator with XRE-family HTH domain